MPAATKNLIIEQKATFFKRLTYRDKFKKPINLTGCTARMQIRAADGTILCDLSTENGRIILGGTTGTIDLLIDDEITALMNFTTANYDFKLMFSNGQSKRLFQGKVTLSPGHTE